MASSSSSTTSPTTGPGRRSRACDECARRKIRCGPERPCHSCLQRGIGRFCAAPSFVDIVHPSPSANVRSRARLRPPSTIPHDVDVALLHERIANLEEQLARTYRPAELAATDGILYPPALGLSYEVDELDASMEHLNLGLADGNFDAHQQPIIAACPPALLARPASTTIVRFVLAQLGWLHCALIANDFADAHERFWDAIDAGDYRVMSQSSFTSIYYAVLSVGLYYTDASSDIISAFGFHDSHRAHLHRLHADMDLITLSRYWYWVALRDLEMHDFLGKPRLSTIQVVAILTLVNSSFGQNSRESILMGVAVKMARMLQMHRLSNEDGLPSPISKLPEWSTREKRDLGRRLWWTLVICDWMGVMSHRPSISPYSFDTVLDLGAPADDIVVLKTQEQPHELNPPSSLHYHQLMAKLAGILRAYVKSGHNLAPSNRATAMQEVEKLYRACPSHLGLDGSQTDEDRAIENAFPHVAMQRYLAVHTVQFIRLTIARRFLTSWMQRQPDPEGLHMKACQAADIIVAAKKRDVPAAFRKSWIVCASTVATGVFLCLDLLFFGTGEDRIQLQNRYDAVQVCIHALRDTRATNVISRRGLVVLEALLDVHATWAYDTVPDPRALQRVIALVSQAQRDEAAREAAADANWTCTVGGEGGGGRPGGDGQFVPDLTGKNMPPGPVAGGSLVPEEDVLPRWPGLGSGPPGRNMEATASPETSLQSSQFAWDYLMDGGSVRDGRDMNQMELDELGEFENPFQFSDSMYYKG